MKLFRIVDPFTLTLVVTVLLASFFPARGGFVPFFEGLTTAAIALLFFMHGAKLSREAIIAGGATAAASLGDVQHVHSLPDPRRTFCLVGTGQRRPGALYRFSVSLYSAGYRAIRHCLYLSGGRERCGRRLLGIGIQPAGDFRLPAAGGPANEHARRGR